MTPGPNIRPKQHKSNFLRSYARIPGEFAPPQDPPQLSCDKPIGRAALSTTLLVKNPQLHPQEHAFNVPLRRHVNAYCRGYLAHVVGAASQ